jgi:S-formylglutathione hydrolase FrmB
LSVRATRTPVSAARRPADPTRAAGVAAALLAAALGTALLGGCQGGSPSYASAQAGAPKPRTAPEASAAPVPTRPCASADLTVLPAQHETKQGLEIERFTVATTSPVGCTLHGTPNLSPKGPLSDQEPDMTVDLAVSQHPVPDIVGLAAGNGGAVALPPGKTASFYLAWFSTSSVVCVQAGAFGFNVPGDTAYTDMQVVAYDIGSLCDGIFYVSPVYAT